MKKVGLVIQDRNQDEALVQLRELGLLHIELGKAASDKLSKAVERKAVVESALALIQSIKVQKAKPDSGQKMDRRAIDKISAKDLEPYSLDMVNAPVRPDLVQLMLEMGRERKALEEQEIFLTRERGRVAPWGEFSPDALKELTSLGQPVHLYGMSHENFKALPDEVNYAKIGEDKSTVRLAVFDREISDAPLFMLPEKSISEIDAELEKINARLSALNEQIKSFATRRSILEKELADINSVINFESVRAKLEKVDGVPDELGFSYITGFVPAEDMPRLKTVAAKNCWALASEDPAEEDENIPTKLKNNKAAQLIYPLTDFLELTPGYREVDISGWFTLFFALFFGMIFGDAAYGALLLAITFFGVIKTAKNGVPLGLKFLGLMGFSTFTWGVLTCSWFGVDIELLPQILRDISLAQFSTAKTQQALVDQNLQLFCFSIALLQLSIGRVTSFLRKLRRKNLQFLAELGSLGMLFGMYNVVLFLVVSNELRSFPLLPEAIYALAGGFFLTFVFASYEGSIFRSILESFKNIIAVILSITNVFSDIMSYIRLWAVGLAGASIAATVNIMAGPLLGNFLIFLGIILLVFGHGLNLVLNVLSVLVHGVRLNTLEFSGTLGLSWSGTPYRPFAQKARK
ncbi:MAG: V-type ATP synthase subunit I [Treponema sp.]|nr:V-type ATP synthase subunit I [Treponema sp.]